MKRAVKSAIVASIIISVVGCATIIQGPTQKVGISSVPGGASVSVDNKPLGVTPLFADLKRGETHVVSIELPGYEKTQLTLTRSVSGWVWGNIVFGGLIGLAIDAISGSMYKLSPEQLSAELRKTDAPAVTGKNGEIIILTTLTPNPAWQKVGQLEITGQ